MHPQYSRFAMHQPYRILYRPEPDARLPRWMQRLWYWFC
jgi:hypothetical protein